MTRMAGKAKCCATAYTRICKCRQNNELQIRGVEDGLERGGPEVFADHELARGVADLGRGEWFVGAGVTDHGTHMDAGCVPCPLHFVTH